MKKIFTTLIIVLSCTILAAQDDLYNSRKIRQDTIFYRTNVDKVQYCLGQYYQQRQSGIMLTFGGAALTIVSELALTNAPKARGAGAVMGGIVSLAGFAITLDAEKWLRNASIKISPTSLIINF